MQLYEHGLRYWQIAQRCRKHRDANPAIVPTAVRDMERLQAETRSPAVLRRINSFIIANRKQLPGSPPDGDGPRYA